MKTTSKRKIASSTSSYIFSYPVLETYLGARGEGARECYEGIVVLLYFFCDHDECIMTAHFIYTQ